MAKACSFFKNRLKSVLDEGAFCTLCDFLDYWIFSNAWIPILFIIVLGVAFEIILIRTCEFFKKKLELWKNGSGSQKNEDVFPKGMTFALESWSITHTSSAERIETFSGSITTTSPSEENGDNSREQAFSSYNDYEFQESHFCESHSSSGGSSVPLSMFHSEVKKIFISHRKDLQSKYQAIQFSSSNLFSIMKTNSTKNSLPDISFQSTFQLIRDKDLNVTPCPLVHLFLSGDQIRQVEENIRRKIPVNPKAMLVREADCLHHRFQEPFIYKLHSNQIFIPGKAQDTFLDRNIIKHQMIHEAHFTRQTQQFIYNQEPVSSQHGFAQPLDLMRMPFSSCMQDSFQTQDIDHSDKSQHFIHIPCIVEIQDSTKGIESDEHFSETQYSIYLNDPNKSNYLVKEQYSDFRNAEFQSLSPNSFAEAVSQQNIMSEAQQLMPSLDSNQYYAYSSMSLSPTIKKQRRKIPDNKRKLSLKVPSLKAKKKSCSQVFPIIVCHTSENKIELRCKKKKIIHQRKIMADVALYLISKLISKLITPHVKKYFLKNLVMVIPDLINHEHFLQEQHRSLDTEKINYTSSTDRVSLTITENVEHSSVVTAKELTAPCSSFETNVERTSEDSVQHTLDLNIPKHEGLSEMLSGSLQKAVSFPRIESHRMKVQKDIQTTANVDELTVSTPNTQRCFPKERIQNSKNSKEIILSFSGINLLLSLGSRTHEENKRRDMNVQVVTGSINLEEEKQLVNNITEYGNQTDNKKLECNTISNKNNRQQYERISDTMQATISEPFGMEIDSKSKAKAWTPIINYNHSALQEKLLDKKKIQELKHIDENSIFRKAQECDRDKEEKSRQTVPPLAEDFIACLKQKVENVQFEMGHIHSENRSIQGKEVESRTISTQTVWETRSCPSTDTRQVVKVWQRTDKPTDREEAAGPTCPPSMLQNLPTSEWLTETTECGIPFSRKSTKTLVGHITEDKEYWIKDLCVVATGPFKTRKKISGTKSILGVKHEIIKVKKPAFSPRLCIRTCDTLIHRREVGRSFESTIKQMLYNATLVPRPLNVHPQSSRVPNNNINIKVTHPKPQVEKKENNLDSLTKENETREPLEVQSYRVRRMEQALQGGGAHTERRFRCDAWPMTEIKMEKEISPAVSFTESIEKSVDSIRMDSFYVANIKDSISTQAEHLNSTELERGPPTSGKSLMGDSLSQSTESSAPNTGNDTKEISCSFAQKALLWLLSYCMPVLTRSKKKRDQTKFTKMSIVKLKYKVKLPASKTSNVRGNKQKSKLDLKAKFKKMNQTKAFLPECQNTICLTIHSRLQGLSHRSQLKQGGLASKVCVACIAESSAFYNREKKTQEEKQNSFLQVLPPHGQHLWADANQRKETLPDLSPSSVSQEQPVNSQSVKVQKYSLQNVLKAHLQMDPLKAKELQKPNKTENGINFPVVPKILFSEVGTSSPGEFANTTDDLEFNKISESEVDLCSVVSNAETSANLQVTSLQSFDSVTRAFGSRPKGERKAPRSRSKKQTPASQRRRTMSEIKLPQAVNFRHSKELKCNKGMKDPRQRANIAAACLDIVPSKVHILPNKKIRSSKPMTEKQRIRRLGHLQLMPEKPNGENAHCSGSADASSFFSMKKCAGEGKENLLISKNSPGFIFGMNQEKDHNLVRSDKQLSQLGRTTTQVQPRTLTEAILCSATCPIPDEFQLERLVAYVSVSPLKFGEAKDNTLSKRECYLVHEKQNSEQTGDSEKEARKLSVSYINPNHSGEIKGYSTNTYQEEKIADETSSSKNAAPNINMRSKIEKSSLSEKTPCFMQMNPEILCHKGKVTSDDVKEIDIPNEEENQNDDGTLSMSLPQQSQHFVFYSYPSRDPNSPKEVKGRGSDILFIVEQDVIQQSQSADKIRREDDTYPSSSKLHSLKSEESQIDVVKTLRTKYHRAADGAQTQELNSWDRDGLKSDLQAAISESLTLSTPDVPRSKRQSKAFTCKALQGKMCSAAVTMKGRKAFVSKVLTIPQCGHRKNLLPKALKSQISELLIRSGVLPDSLNIIILEDPTSEKKKRLTQKLAAIMLETCKESKNLKFMDKGDEMSTSYLTVEANKAATSQTLTTAGCVTPKQCQPAAVSTLHAIFSPVPMSLDVSTCNGVKERDIMRATKFSHELHNQSVHEERSCHSHPTDKDATSNGIKDTKTQGEGGNPRSVQHFAFSSQNVAGSNSVKSGLQMINSAVCCELERTLYDGQAPLVNVNKQQSSMAGVTLQHLNAEESEVGSISYTNTWDGNPRRKCAYPISEQKSWTQKNLRSLKPLQEPSLMSSEEKSENYTLQIPGKREVSPMTKKASRLLDIARQNPRFCRKKSYHNSKHQLRKKVHVEEVLHHAIEDVDICPLKFKTDELLLDTAERTASYSRIPQRFMAEEKAKLQANLATTFSGPYNFFIPVLFDFKSQVNTIKLLENESVLNQRFSTMKKKLSVSKIIKINGYFITNHRKVKLRAKMKALRLSEHLTDVLQNTIYFISTTSTIKNKFKAEVGLGISKFTQTQPTRGESLVEGIIEYKGSVDKNGPNIQVSLENSLSNVRKSHNCLEIYEPASNTTKLGKKKTGQSFLKEKSPFYLTEIVTSIARNLVTSKELKKQIGSMRIPNLSAHSGVPSQIIEPTDSQSPHIEFGTQVFRTPEIKVDNDEVNADIKSVCPCMSIQHIKTELSHKIWDMYRKSAKENCLDRATVKRKEEFGQPILFKIGSQRVQPFEADQKKKPDPFKPEVFSANIVHPKDITLEFKIGWKATSSSFVLLKKQEKPSNVGPMWRSYASDHTYLETLRQKDKAKISSVKSARCAKQIKMKVKKRPVSLLLVHWGRSNKEPGHSMQHQNTLELRKNKQSLVLKANLDPRCSTSQVKKLTRAKLEKGKLEEKKNILPQIILEKPSNQRQMSWSVGVDVSRKPEENIKETNDHSSFNDIRQHFMQQFWVNSEHSCKPEDLQRRMNSELTSQKAETDSLEPDNRRTRRRTKVYSDPQNSLQHEYSLKKGTQRPGMVIQPMKQFSHFKMTNDFIMKQDIKPSSSQRMVRLKVMDKLFDSKGLFLTPRLTVQRQNVFTDPIQGSIPSHLSHQPEEPKEDMKINNKIIKNLTQQLKNISNEEDISDMDHMPSIEKLLLLIKEQEKRRKKSKRGKKTEVAEDIKTTTRKSIPLLNYSPSRTQSTNTVKNSGVFRQRDGTESTRKMGILWGEQRLCVQGISLNYVYTDELTSKVIHQNRRRTAFTESVLYHKRINMKVRKTTSGRLLDITGYRILSLRKERRYSMKTQKELPQVKMVADLPWKELCASGYIASQIKKLMDAREDKGKLQKPYIPPQIMLKKMNKTKRLSVQPIDNNSISSTVRKSTPYTIKHKKHQTVLLDIIPRNKDQLITGQQVKELGHINFNSHLEKEANRAMLPGTGKADHSRLESQRPKEGTDFECSTAQSIKQGVLKDSIKHALSVPPRRGGPKKTNTSSSKEHDLFLTKLDTFQKNTCTVQELLKQSTSRVGLGPVACPVKESFDSENTKVPKKMGMYCSIKNISPHSGREGLRETDKELGSKSQASLCTDPYLHKTGTTQRNDAKSTQKPRTILNSVHKRAPFYLKPIWSTTMKDSGLGPKKDLKGKEKAEPADSPLKLNRQKVDSSKKLRPKHLIIFIQKKEQILEFFLSCILYQLQAKNTQKQISAKAALHSKVFKPVEEKTPSKVNILEDQSSSSEGVNQRTKGGKDWQENVCQAFPMSTAQPLMDKRRIILPQVKKAFKTVGNLDYHPLNTENGEQKRRVKTLNQHQLSFSFKNLEEHIFCSPNYSYVQLEPQTKGALSEVANLSSRTRELDLSSKDTLSAVYECRPERIFPSVISESRSKTIKCPSLLLSERKQSPDGMQTHKSVSNESSPMLRVSRTKLLAHKANKKKQEELYLPELFSHCLSLYMLFLHEDEKLKGNIEYGVMKDIMCLERKAINLKRLELPPTRFTGYAQSNKAEAQCYRKKNMMGMKHRKDAPGSVVMTACEPIPLPHFKLDQKKIDGIISSNVRQKKCESQEEDTGIKEMKIDGIIGSNITLKTKESISSYSSSGKKLTLCFDATKKGKVQEKFSKADTKQKKSFLLLPCLSNSNLNSKIKVGKAKSELLKDCLPPLKPLLSLKDRTVPLLNPFNRDNLGDLIELNYLPQRKEYRNNIPHLKDIIGLKHIARKGKKLPFKYLLRGKESWWDNKIQKFIQGNKNNLDVVQNKLWDSVPSSSFLEWDPKTMEAYLKGITKFCLESPSVLVSGALGMYQELTEDVLNSIEKANYMPLKERLQIESKEVIHSSRLSLRQKLPSAPQELQFNVEEKGEKIQDDKNTKNWNKPSIYSLSYFQEDTRANGEEVMQVRTQSSSRCSELQRPSDTGEVVYKKSTFEPVLNSVKHSLEYVIQKEESTKTEKNIHLKENQSVSQKIQLDIKETEQELQIKDALNAMVTNTSKWTQTNINENSGYLQERKCKLGESLVLASLPHSKLVIETKGKEKTGIETGSCSLHSWNMESSDAEKLHFAASSLNNTLSDPKRSRCLSYKEDEVNPFKRITMHPKAKHVNMKKSPLSCVPPIKRFKVDLEEQSKRKHESRTAKAMLLRGARSVVTSSDVCKIGISEEVETETMQSHKLYPVLQKLLPEGQVGCTNTIANNFKKRKLHPPWEEEETQTSAIDNFTHPSSQIFMTKISAPPSVSGVKKHRILSTKKTHQWNSNEKTEQKKERARHHNVVATKCDSSASLLTTGQIAPTKQVSKCSKKRKSLTPVQEEVQTPATDGSTYSSGRVLKAKISAPAHVFSLSEHSTSRKRQTLHGKNKEKVRQKQEKARKFNEFVTKSDSSWPSRVSKNKDIPGKIQFSLPTSKVKDVSDSDKKICMKPSGYGLSNIKEPTQEEGKNILRKEMQDEKIPKSIDKKVKKLSRSYIVSIKELQRKSQGKKLLDLASTIVNLSILQLQLMKFSGSQIANRKVYGGIKLLKEHVPQKEKAGKKKHVVINRIIVHPKNIHLKTKRSPILPTHNLSDLTWETGKREGIKEDRSEPRITLTKKLTKILTAMSPEPVPTMNTGIQEECASVLTRPPVSMGNLQKSTDSEDRIYSQSITGNSSISLHSEKHVSEEKEEVGMQVAKLITTHRYQETKVQKCKDEQGLVLTKSSLFLDFPHPQLYKKTEFSNIKLRLRNPALQRISPEGETEPRETGITVGDTTKDFKKHHMPQREEIYKKEKIGTIDRRGTDVTLKSQKSPLSQKLHRTELHMRIKAPKPKHSNREPRVLRKMCTSTGPLSGVTRCQGVQVVEVNHLLDSLESHRSSPLPQIVPAFSDTEKMTHKKDMCTHVKKGKQYSKQIEKTVNLTIKVPCKKAKASPISYLLNANEFVLNMKVLEKKVHKNKSELTVVASRTFLSIPSADSRYSQDKTQEGTVGLTKFPHPQENFEEPADAQDTEIRELAEVDFKCIVKATEHNVLLKQTRPQKSKCVTSALRISQHLHTELECKPTSPHHKIDLTRLGTIIGEKVLDMFFKLQKGQPGKYKKEPSTKILNWKKESEIKDNLSHKAKFPVSPLFSSEKIPLEKLSIVYSGKSQDEGKQNVMTTGPVKPSAKGGQQVKPKPFPSLHVPVPSRNQQTSLQVNVNKKTVVNISPQIQSEAHMSRKEFYEARGKEDPSLIVIAKQNLQGQKIFQTNNFNSLYAYIPICPKSQKSRFTVINLKRELKPKYSTMKVPKHPISKMLGIIGWSSPSRKGKLEYAFNKPKAMVPRSKDTSSGIIIRNLGISMINPPHNEGIIESKTNPRREIRDCHSKFQEKLPDARKVKDILTHKTSFDTAETHLRRTTRIHAPRLQPLPGTPLFDKMKERPLLSKLGEASPGTVPTIFRDKKNENKTLVEHLFPIYKILKSVFEVPVENKIRNQVLSEILEEVEADKPGNAKASLSPENPDTSPKIYATLLRTPLLKQLTPELKNKLTMHLVSKATEIKLNQIPEMVNTSLQKCDSHPQGTISEDHSYKFYLKHIKMNFKSPKVDIIHASLKNNYERDFPPLSCVKTPIVNVSSSNKKAMTEPKAIKKQESVTSLASLSNLPLIHVLHKFSEEEKDNLLVHLCIKTAEIQAMGLPRIATQSYEIANGQDKSRPLFKCIHSATKGPKQKNKDSVLFDEKSFCEIDCDLQHKYLCSAPNASVTVVSVPNALPKHTSKISKGLGSECEKVDGSKESSSLSFDKECLQHVSFPKINPQESSVCFRKFQEPTNVPAFYPGLQDTEQNDIILSDLKLQMTPEKNKKCCVWLQETSAYKHSAAGAQQSTAGLTDSHSSWFFADWMNVPLKTETSTDTVESQAPEGSNNEECVFIETNFYLTRDSQNFLSDVPKGIPLADVHISDEATYLKPFSHEDPNDGYTRTYRKHISPAAQTFYLSQNSRKCRSNSKMQPPDWLSHSSSSAVEIESTSSSIMFNEKKHWTATTWSRTSCSLTSSTTESSIKLSLTKKHAKYQKYPQLKNRKKARSDVWTKPSIYQSSHHSHLHSKEKHTKKKRQTNQMPEPNAHWQNIRFYSERKENQPFFYVCVPADSMDVIPQTIRWIVPRKILQKGNFHIPQVASISNSWNLWTSSKKLLGSLAGAFNTVR